MPNLQEVLAQLRSLPSESTIYVARPWNAEATAVVCDEEVDGPPAGCGYFLEVNIARDAVDVWTRWRGGRLPSMDETVGAVIYYAEFDAFMPVEVDR